jgi:N-acetylmuramoyl-L-alanine amidase
MMPGLTPRKLTDFIVVHCSASQPDIKTDAKVIDRWHRQRGFLMIGYHFVIKTDGAIEKGRDEDAVGAHVEGYNARSIGICMVGGVDKDGKSVNNFSQDQMLSLLVVLKDLKKKHPKAVIQGHRDFPKVAKDCPCFDVKAWVKTVMAP